MSTANEQQEQMAENNAGADIFTGDLPLEEARQRLRLRLLDLTGVTGS